VKAALLIVGLAACGAAPSACPLDPDLDAAECASVAAMRLPAALPPSPTNAHADDDAAATLGFHIFYDARFSTTHKVRCASCHAPETHFDDAHATATGIAAGTRNAPSVLGVARRTRGFFWDGRADVLWAPPILAMENPIEMGMPRLEIVRVVATYHADAYTSVFGALPAVDGSADAAAIDRVAANVGKALEAYLRKLATGPSAFDRFLDGDRAALTPHQQRGLTVFVVAGCPACHGGPLFTDDAYRNLGVPAWDGAADDQGRAAGVALERAQVFSPGGAYSDAPTDVAIADPIAADVGAFRTPTLRNVAVTGPYMHNGRFASLADAIAFHATLDAPDLDAVVDFLGGLTGAYPEPPWNNWPDTP
jgi:cytochrome c peroxidase